MANAICQVQQDPAMSLLFEKDDLIQIQYVTSRRSISTGKNNRVVRFRVRVAPSMHGCVDLLFRLSFSQLSIWRKRTHAETLVHFSMVGPLPTVDPFARLSCFQRNLVARFRVRIGFSSWITLHRSIRNYRCFQHMSVSIGALLRALRQDDLGVVEMKVLIYN